MVSGAIHINDFLIIRQGVVQMVKQFFQALKSFQQKENPLGLPWFHCDEIMTTLLENLRALELNRDSRGAPFAHRMVQMLGRQVQLIQLEIQESEME